MPEGRGRPGMDVRPRWQGIGGCVLNGSPEGRVQSTNNSQRESALHNIRKGGTGMVDKDTIFVLTKEDVVECAREMGIPEEAITDDMLQQVRKGVEWGLECWSEVMKEAINMALKS